MSIEPTLPAETPALLALTETTGVFKPLEIVALREVLDDYHPVNQADGHRAFTFLDQGRPIGFAYYAATPMTDRTWHLYWIAVTKNIQAKGVGSRLLQHVENDIRQAGGRLLLIETSAMPHYDLT